MRVTKAIALSLVGYLAALAGPVEAAVSPYVELFFLDGHIGYHIEGTVIGGETPGPFESELTFQLDNIAIRAGGFFDVSDRIQLGFGGWTTLDSDVGQLGDRDWLEDGYIYVWSKSAQSLNAWGLSGEFRYWLLKGEEFSLAPAGQITYDDFYCQAWDSEQHSTDPRFDKGKVLGLAAIYKQESVSFQVGVVLAWSPVSWFRLGWTGFLSPITYVWDRDDHVRRSMLAEGKAPAFCVSTSLTPEFIVFKRAHVGPWAYYYFLEDYDSEQVQVYYAGPYKEKAPATVADSMERDVWAAGLRMVVDLF